MHPDGDLETGVRRLAALETDGFDTTAGNSDDAMPLPTRLVRHRVEQVSLACKLKVLRACTACLPVPLAQ